MLADSTLARSGLYELIQRIRGEWELGRWRKRGPGLPAPGLYKQRLVRRFGRRFGLDTFIETGTHYGAMVCATRRQFRRVFTIEIDARLHARAQWMFRRYPNVTVLRGDSGQVLPEILGPLRSPSLFWLDAHYSGTGTGRGQEDSPVLRELRAILAHPVRGHVLLIDDAREFTGNGGYPSLEALRSTVHAARPSMTVHVLHDIIRIHEGP